MMMTEQDMFKTAQIGIEAEKFLSTDLGIFLLGKAEMELETGFSLLLDALPTDYATITKLQSQCKRALNFKSWLAEAIQSGEYAVRELRQDE